MKIILLLSVCHSFFFLMLDVKLRVVSCDKPMSIFFYIYTHHLSTKDFTDVV